MNTSTDNGPHTKNIENKYNINIKTAGQCGV